MSPEKISLYMSEWHEKEACVLGVNKQSLNRSQ